MKRFISLMTALILALSACAVSFADDPDEVQGTVEMPYAGLRFVPPEAFRNTKGHIVTDGAIKITQGIWYAYWIYCAMTEEELVAVIQPVGFNALSNGKINTHFHAIMRCYPIPGNLPQITLRRI